MKNKYFISSVFYQKEKWDVFFSYTLAESKRIFKIFEEDVEIPFDFDYRHQLKFHAQYKIKPNLTAGFNFQASSPSPKLLIQSLEESIFSSAEEEEELDGRTNFYHRADFNLSYQIHRPKLQHELKLGVYNLYNRQNISFYRFEYGIPEGPDFEDPELKTVPVASLPVLPAFSYTLRF